MKNKKLLSLVLATTLVCSGAFAANTSDVEQATSLKRAYMEGYPGNLAKPDGNITRAEAVALYTRLKEKTMNVKA